MKHSHPSPSSEVSATECRLAALHSRIINEGGHHHLPNAKPGPKIMDVNITILSLTGFRATDDTKNKKSMATVLEQIRTDAGSNHNITNSAKIVASFDNGSKTPIGTPMTHIPSLSFPFSATSTFSDVVSWPERAAESFWPEQAAMFAKLSSFQFQRKFVPEGGTGRFEPHLCPIQISVCRNGKIYKLGVASVFINGEEKGEWSISVPVTIDERMFNGSKHASDDLTVPMVTLKGDTMKCSLDRNSSIRVIVKVSDLSDPNNPTNATEPAWSQTNEDLSLNCESKPIFLRLKDEVRNLSPSAGKQSFTSPTSLDYTASLSLEKPTDSFSSISATASSTWERVSSRNRPSYSESKSNLIRPKDELRNGGFLLPSSDKQKLMSPTSFVETASASLENTTFSSSSRSTTSSSISSGMVSSLKEFYQHSKARSWGNRLFACSVPICSCREKNDDLSAVDEDSVLTDKYSLQSRYE